MNEMLDYYFVALVTPQSFFSHWEIISVNAKHKANQHINDVNQSAVDRLNHWSWETGSLQSAFSSAHLQLSVHFLLDSCVHLNNNFTWWRLNVWISAGCVSAWCCCCIFVIISEVLPPSSGRTEKHNMTWWPSSRRLLHIKLLYRCFCRSQLSPGLLQVELTWFLVVSMIHSSVMLVGGFVLHRDRGDLFMLCML